MRPVPPSPAGPRRRGRLLLELLEDRILLSVLDLQGGLLTYRASAGVANQLLLAQQGSLLSLTDRAETISLTAAARQAGCLGDGGNVVTCPAGSVGAVVLLTGDAADQVAVQALGLTPAVLLENTGLADLLVDDRGDPNPAGANLVTGLPADLLAEAPALGSLPDSVLQALRDASYVGGIAGADPNPIRAVLGQTAPPDGKLGHPLIPAGVFFTDRLSSLTLDGGDGENVFRVFGTPGGGAFTATTLNTGAGMDVIDVQATVGPLAVNGQDGRDEVFVGHWAALPTATQPPPRVLATIQGSVTVGNAGSLTDLVVDDSGDPFPQAVTVTSDQIVPRGSAAIHFDPDQLASLTFNAGPGGNAFTVADTPAPLTTTLQTGPGDRVNVRAATGPLKVLDATASAQVTAAPGAAVTHVLVRAPIQAFAPVVGTLAGPADVDLYPVHVSAPGTLTVQVGPGTTGTLDARLGLYNIDSYLDFGGLRIGGGGLLAESDDQAAGSPDPSVSLFLLPGDYFVTVAADRGGAYVLTPSFVPGSNPFTGLDVDPALNRTVGTNPVAVLAADVNADGIPDLVTVNEGSGDVSVLLGVGNGSFASQIRVPVGVHPGALALGDFNGDGRLDVATLDASTGVVTVVPGNGDGTFAAGSALPLQVPGRPVALAAGEFTGDGKDDLATLDGVTGLATVFPGSADGTFTPRTAFVVAGNDPRFGGHLAPGPVPFAAADFNRDGYGDVATLVPADGGGPPGFANVLHLALGVPARIEGTLDTGLGPVPIRALVQTQIYLPANAITPGPSRDTPQFVDLGGGAGGVVTVTSSGDILFRAALPGAAGFGAPQTVNARGAPGARAVAVVRDGPAAEVAALDLGGPTISLYRRQPDGTWKWTPLPAAGIDPEQITAGDLNGDGVADLVVANNFFGLASLSVYRGEPDGTFTHVRDIKVGTDVSQVVLADVNGDGRLDVVVANPDAGDVGVLLNAGLTGGNIGFRDELRLRAGDGVRGVELSDGTQAVDEVLASFGSSVTYPDLYFVTSNEESDSVAVGDFTGDGAPDLVVADRGSDALGLLQGKGTGSFADPRVLPVNRPTVVVTGDFDRDGKQDLAVLNEDTSTITVLRGDGRGGFTAVFTTGAGSRPTGLAVEDVNGDGRPDLVVGNKFGDVLVLVGQGDGTFVPPPPFTGDRAPLDVKDLGNGQPDALVANQQASQVNIQAPAATGPGFVPVQPLDAADPGTQLAPGAVAWSRLDRGGRFFDAVVMGSGSNDVLVYRATGFDAAGRPTFAAAVAYPVGTHPVGVTIQDINGDGIPDLLVPNQGSNDVSVLFGSLRADGAWVGMPGPRLKSGGTGPIAVMVRDANGDGIPDLVVTNGGSGTLTVLPGVGHGFFNDRAPQLLVGLGTTLVSPPVVMPGSGSAVAVTGDGRLAHFNLGGEALPVQIVSAPDPGAGVAAVVVRDDGSLVLAETGGNVELAGFTESGQLEARESFTALTGTPFDPSALALLPDGDVLVTNVGQDALFVFGLAGPGQAGNAPEVAESLLPSEPGSAPATESSAPSEAPLALVVALVADVLHVSDTPAEIAGGPAAGAEASSARAAPAAPVEPAGNEDEQAPPDTPTGEDFDPDVMEMLRQLNPELYRQAPASADGPILGRTEPEPSVEAGDRLAGVEAVPAGEVGPNGACLERPPETPAAAASRETGSDQPAADAAAGVWDDWHGPEIAGPGDALAASLVPEREASIVARDLPHAAEAAPDGMTPALLTPESGWDRERPMLAALALGGLAVWAEWRSHRLAPATTDALGESRRSLPNRQLNP